VVVVQWAIGGLAKVKGLDMNELIGTGIIEQLGRIGVNARTCRMIILGGDCYLFRASG
jgi:hypothetical protein